MRPRSLYVNEQDVTRAAVKLVRLLKQLYLYTLPRYLSETDRPSSEHLTRISKRVMLIVPKIVRRLPPVTKGMRRNKIIPFVQGFTDEFIERVAFHLPSFNRIGLFGDEKIIEDRRQYKIERSVLNKLVQNLRVGLNH